MSEYKTTDIAKAVKEALSPVPVEDRANLLCNVMLSYLEADPERESLWEKIDSKVQNLGRRIKTGTTDNCYNCVHSSRVPLNEDSGWRECTLHRRLVDDETLCTDWKYKEVVE